jgi:hypothetical protein
MAFTHGKDSVFSLDNTAGSPTDISAYVDSIDGLPGEVEMAEVTAMGDEGKKNIPGLEGASISISGHWDSTEDGIFGSPTQWKAATRSFAYGPAGSTGGYVKYSGECWITNYVAAAAVADKVSWTATLLVDGVVSRGTY